LLNVDINFEDIINKTKETTPKKQTIEYDLLMVIDNVFFISDRGIIFTGTIQGNIHIGDKVEIIDGKDESVVKEEITVIRIEMFGKECESATDGDIIGLGLEGIKNDDIRSGLKIVIKASDRVFNHIQKTVGAIVASSAFKYFYEEFGFIYDNKN